MRKDIQVTLLGVLVIGAGVATAGIGSQIVAMFLSSPQENYIPAAPPGEVGQNGEAEVAREVLPLELRELMEKTPSPFVIDVRTPQEYATAHIKGAVAIPQEDLGARMAGLPKDRKIVLYCRSGPQSLALVPILRNAGFDAAASLSGGFRAWSDLWDAEKYVACTEDPNGLCE